MPFVAGVALDSLIETCLTLYAGWDKDKRRYDHRKRVTLMIEDFVVVIRMKSVTEADRVGHQRVGVVGFDLSRKAVLPTSRNARIRDFHLPRRCLEAR
jgi:hypothetical protein